MCACVCACASAAQLGRSKDISNRMSHKEEEEKGRERRRTEQREGGTRETKNREIMTQR